MKIDWEAVSEFADNKGFGLQVELPDEKFPHLYMHLQKQGKHYRKELNHDITYDEVCKEITEFKGFQNWINLQWV